MRSTKTWAPASCPRLRLATLALGLGVCLALGSAGRANAQTAAAAAAEAAPVLPAATFFRHADVGDAKLSPSGKLLAVSLALSGRRALGVYPLDGGAPRTLAHYADRDINSFEWVGDTHLVFDLVDNQSGSGDQRTGSGLFVVEVSDGHVRQMAHLQGDDYSDRSAMITRKLLSSSHRLLAVPEDGSNEVVVGRLSWGTDWALKEVVPLRLNVTTLGTRAFDMAMPEASTGWIFDQQGEPRVAMARQQGQVRVHWRAPGSASWTLLASMPAQRLPWWPHSVDSQGQLYVTMAEGPQGYGVLKRFDFERQQPEAAALVSTPGFDFSGRLVRDRAVPAQPPGASAPGMAATATSGGGGALLGVHALTDAGTSVWLDPKLKAWQQQADQQLPGRVNRLECRRCHGDDPVVLVTSWSDREPGGYYIFRPINTRQPWVLMARERPEIQPRQMATLDFFRVPTRDGLSMPLWLTLPVGASDKAPRAAVLLVHGGPWHRGSQWAWKGEAQFLANRGYVVIEPEYRGSLGYGRAWFQAGIKQWGQRMQDDLADAVQWAVSKGHVDPKRVCIAGASYGGYAALMGPVRHPGLFRCVVASAGVTDLPLMYDTSTLSNLSAETLGYTWPELLGHPVADAQMLKVNSPVNLAEQMDVPVLLAYGAQDRRVQMAHGERMRAALTKAGRPPEWVVYADEGHGWQTTQNRVDFAQRLERFLAQHLK